MNETEKRLYIILKKFYESEKLEELWLNHGGDSLTGTEWGMSGNTLTYLLLETEKEFDVAIDTMDLVQGKFNTIEEIVSLLA